MTLGLGLGLFPGIQGGAAAPAFDPASLFSSGEDGYIYDVQADGAVFEERTSPTTPPNDGDDFGTLLDLSGNGNHAIAPSDSDRPRYEIDANGPRCNYAFTLGSRLVATFDLNQPTTIVGAFVNPSAFVTGVLIDGLSSFSCALFGDSNVPSFFAGGSVISASAVTANEGFVITVRSSGATSRIARNAEAYATGNTGSRNAGGVSLGATTSGANGGSASLYRVIGIGRDLTDDEITSARQWCAEAAGVTL